MNVDFEEKIPKPASDDLIGALAVIVLLIGTASDNALFMLGLSLTMLIIMTLFWRKRLGRGGIFVATIGAVAAAMIAAVLAWL